MKFKDILAISGKPGLYQFVSQGRNGIIVEAIADKKRMAVSTSTKVSGLDDIAIYTSTEEVPLKQVFVKIYEKENGAETISHKSSNDELKVFFENILPDYDKERVYTSDIKKLVNWYNLLIAYKLFDPKKLEEEAKEAEAEKNTEEGKATASKASETMKDKVAKSAKKPVASNATKGAATARRPAMSKAGGATARKSKGE